MKFAEPFWLFGTALALLVAGIYIWGGLKQIAATKRFGDPTTVSKLFTARSSGRRATKSALVVLSVALAFIALAGPQYGRGTRLIPATNLDCVIVLDYSKSMYAQDISPSRIERAKIEVARLISRLPGARFGAVGFAGEPLSFPLTSDGGAIAQFFRQTTPNDMPIGGTAIARALEAARELMQRDPLSKKHQKVILLVTDGEDLEGNPVDVAQAAAQDGILLHVVQIGTRAPETIPEVDELGKVVGIRRDSNGKPMTTSLSSAGEEQLAAIARTTSGRVVRAEAGQTGIDEIADELNTMMTEELAERVETVYADVFYYPLGLALLLLLLEVFVPQTRRKQVASLALLAVLTQVGCKDQERELFTRHSPVVDQAIVAIRTVDAGTASTLLSDYLSTGKCKDGTLGTPDRIRALPNATLDLGLTLFQLAERYGGEFGQAPPDERDPNSGQLLARRSEQVDCALRLVSVIAADKSVPLELRAQAHYLSGNLEFLRFNYRAAVDSYDEALKLYPGGDPDAGTELGTKAAFNRAIALARAIEDEENQPPPPDGGTPPPSDGGEPQDQDQDQNQDQQDEQQQDQQDEQQQDEQQQDEQQQDQDQDQQDAQDQDQQDQQQSQQQQPGQEQPPTEPQPAQAGPTLSQDERILDQLEQAPMFQHVQQGQQGRPRPRMEDK